jgi:hypothetical protein
LKVLSTCFLFTVGAGYLVALAYLYLIDLEPHTKHGFGVVQAVIAKYHGNRQASRLETALAGSMGEMVTLEENRDIIRWLRQGAHEAEFVRIQPILKRACAVCHSPELGRPTTPPLTSYAEVAKYTGVDVGASIKSLIGSSHIHLFGMSLIFMFTGAIFALSETPRIFRLVVVAVPFLAIWFDIGSWWFTKYEPLFAYTLIIGAVLMGISLTMQIGISLYEMWFAPCSQA